MPNSTVLDADNIGAGPVHKIHEPAAGECYGYQVLPGFTSRPSLSDPFNLMIKPEPHQCCRDSRSLLGHLVRVRRGARPTFHDSR